VLPVVVLPVLDPDPDPVGVGADARTTTVPSMNGWIVQKYVNVPVCVNVCDAL
jgi:hypothetical protein